MQEEQAKIGRLLALLQHVERAIDVYLAWALPDQPITIEQIASLKKSKQKQTLEQIVASFKKPNQKKQTLGKLFKTFRKRSPAFDKSLNPLFPTFVEDRNRFVHRLFTEPGYDINNPEDLSRIREFVHSLALPSVLFYTAFDTFNDLTAKQHDLAHPDRFQFFP